MLQKESSLATDENTTPPVDDAEMAVDPLATATQTVVSESTVLTEETSETGEPTVSIAETVTVTDAVVADKTPA